MDCNRRRFVPVGSHNRHIIIQKNQKSRHELVIENDRLILCLLYVLFQDIIYSIVKYGRVQKTYTVKNK